jgi:prepilin-type N-terminal cleavage/methylation domain-containing protein
MKNDNLGFTLIELIVVMVIVASLFGLIIFNLIGTEKTSEVSAASDSLISNLSSQQTKAMLGAGTSNGVNYGIHFQSDRYVLFQGNSYSPADSNNFIEMLDEGLVISNILMPAGSNLIFTSATGTVSGYLNGNNYGVSISNADGHKTITITVNRYGVVTGEN